jgi:hypothetical protein
MKSIYVLTILILGFLVYWIIKDNIFSSTNPKTEPFNTSYIPAKSDIEIRQAPLYPERNVSPSGPNPPNQQAPENEIVIHNEPIPKDPYSENHQSSDIPEDLRYPERSFRPTISNTATQIGVESGVASNNIQVTANNSQQYSTDFIQSGGEFMPGIYANDTFLETNFSTF